MKRAAIVGIAWLLAGCGRPTCKSGDLECLAKSFSIVDFADFTDSSKRDALSLVDASKLTAAQKGTGQLTLALPAGGLNFPEPDDGAILLLQWQDGLGCRPSFCFSHCPRGVRCSTSPRCTPGRADGQTGAATEHWIEYGSSPAQSEDFDLDVVAVSAPGCPTDPATILAASGAQGSETLVVPVHIDLNGASAGTSGGSTSGSSGTTGSGPCAHWTCNGQAQCESVMGGPQGVQCQFAAGQSCEQWCQQNIPGACTCS